MLHITSQNKEALESEVKFVLDLFAIKPKSSRKKRTTKADTLAEESFQDHSAPVLAHVAAPTSTAKTKAKAKVEAAKDNGAHADSDSSEAFIPGVHKEPVGQKVSLQQVGDSLIGRFVSVGSAYVSKAKRHCVVMQLEMNGEDCWLLGSTLTEAVNSSRTKPGDVIRVTKTKQFKKAANHSHAAAAEFEISKL